MGKISSVDEEGCPKGSGGGGGCPKFSEKSIGARTHCMVSYGNGITYTIYSVNVNLRPIRALKWKGMESPFLRYESKINDSLRIFSPIKTLEL